MLECLANIFFELLWILSSLFLVSLWGVGETNAVSNEFELSWDGDYSFPIMLKELLSLMSFILIIFILLW